ncbi:MAG: alpha/beta fold hydrolase [Promethearchaeota archaeon]
MPITKLNDTKLYYDKCGSGSPFLIMHGGLGVDHSYFRPVLDSLGDIFQLIYYDHRGHGRSERSEINKITFEQLADDANILRKTLGYEKIGIIGHSAGGFVALHYALRHHEHISYLILLDTTPAFDHMEEMMELIQKKKPSQEILTTLNAPAAPSEKEFKNQFKIIQPLYFSDYTNEFENLITTMIEKMIMVPELNARSDELLETYDVSSQLKNIKIPTLILVGKDDFICPPSQAQRLHDKIPNSDLHIFEKSGHYPFYEESDNFFKVIRDWFKKVK